MKVKTYAYGGIAIIAALCGVMAFTFYRMGFVGIGPFALAVILVVCAGLGFLKSLPERKKKPKKSKKSKKAEEAPVALPPEE